MPTLEQLRQKWFINPEDMTSFPPPQRLPGSQLAPYTDGNLVTHLHDGAGVMALYADVLDSFSTAETPQDCHFWFMAMGVDRVPLRGVQVSKKDAWERLWEAAEQGVNIFYLGSGQLGLGRKSQAFSKELNARGGHGTADARAQRLLGGHHQKMALIRQPDGAWIGVVSSADMFTARWDTPDHLEHNPNRPSETPTHELAFKVQGPAVRDIALTFTERWNDPKNLHRTRPRINTQIPADWLPQDLPTHGTHSVQLLRTNPLLRDGEGYTWSDKGEFTIWAAYLNAIQKAEKYIYLEDQYFYTFQDPVVLNKADRLRETDIVYQLGEALKRGVDVLALVPGRDDKLPKQYENQQRRRATAYLHQIATKNPQAGRFVVAKPVAGQKDVTVHAKLMLVDDEYVLAGSANICQRSIAYNTEIQAGVVDAENRFVRELRQELWAEHMGSVRQGRVGRLAHGRGVICRPRCTGGWSSTSLSCRTVRVRVSLPRHI
jgi:phosphatidylserine/phosphatidylglycerophosphate/cardiolipin synthase-like enzyme